MAKFRKKPVVIEAVQWRGANVMDIMALVTDGGNRPDDKSVQFDLQSGYPAGLVITTLEGPMRADLNDWIIRGIKGEFYPIKADIFLQTYDPVEEA